MPTTEVHFRPDTLIETLYLEHRPRAFRYARWLLNNDNDAEEVVQEAFLRLTKYQAKLATENQDRIEPADESRLTGILFTTIRNLAIDGLRKKGRRQDVALESVSEPEQKYSDDDAARRLETKITSLIQMLPDNWAEALKLKITGELSYDQIADVLKCTKAQVRTWIFRGRRQIANELTKQGWLETGNE